MKLGVVLICLALTTPCVGQESRLVSKKVLEWGWDEPDTKFLRENIQRMEQLPFDGLVFHVKSDKGDNLTWKMWGAQRFELAEFQQSLDDLRNTRFERFSERLLRVNVTPGHVDWFDDDAWSVVAHNFSVAAGIAKQGGCRGFMFDVEQYEGGLFAFAKQPQRSEQSFAEHQAKVRQRGQEWIRAVNAQFPDITILLTFGYRIAMPAEGTDRSATEYGLLADFLDGILDGCTAETKLVDAWEYSYSYKRAEQFQQAYDTIKTKSLEWTAQKEKYQQQVQAGFGIWMDCAWREKGWNLEDFSKNYFTPTEFQQAVRLALERTDRYVWIYTEQPLWWTNQRLPAEYVSALSNARQAD